MWHWKVTLERDGEKIIVYGSPCTSDDVARIDLVNWLHEKLPGLYLYRLTDAEIVLIQGKEG